MTVTFRKLHACGRDYLCLGDTRETDPAVLARHLASPESGIGADGILLLRAREEEAPVLYCFSPSGGQIPAPRGALLAGAKYLYDTAQVNLTEFCLTERGTPHRIRLETRGGAAWGVTGEGGFPTLDAARYSATLTGLVRDMPITVGGIDCHLTVAGIGGMPVAVLTGKAHTPPKPGNLLRVFSVPVSVLYVTDDPLEPRVLLRSREADGTVLASAAVVAGAICGRLDFCTPYAIALPGEAFQITVSPNLRLTVTWEVSECFRGTTEL